MSRSTIIILGIISLFGFVLIAVSYESRLIIQIDEWIIQGVQQYETNQLTSVMKLFTFVGSGKIVSLLALVVIVWLLLLKHRLEMIIFFVTVCGSSLLNILLKLLFERTRPTIHPIIVEAGYSFPSGHSMSAFTFYGIVTFLLWRHIPNHFNRILLIGFSVFMVVTIGLSRVYLGVHYPSDVIGAYLASCTWLIIMIYVASQKKSLH